MNTGLLRYAVGTVLTVYGIETNTEITYICIASTKLEQCLPFTVLKLKGVSPFLYDKLGWNSAYRLRYWNLESDYDKVKHLGELEQCLPFTVLKRLVAPPSIFVDSELEQCLPFTVLKLVTLSVVLVLSELEQCLPFTVLKRIKHRH